MYLSKDTVFASTYWHENEYLLIEPFEFKSKQQTMIKYPIDAITAEF